MLGESRSLRDSERESLRSCRTLFKTVRAAHRYRSEFASVRFMVSITSNPNRMFSGAIISAETPRLFDSETPRLQTFSKESYDSLSTVFNEPGDALQTAGT